MLIHIQQLDYQFWLWSRRSILTWGLEYVELVCWRWVWWRLYRRPHGGDPCWTAQPFSNSEQQLRWLAQRARMGSRIEDDSYRGMYQEKMLSQPIQQMQLVHQTPKPNYSILYIHGDTYGQRAADADAQEPPIWVRQFPHSLSCISFIELVTCKCTHTRLDSTCTKRHHVQCKVEPPMS